jgi:hypothetical protein
MMRAALHALLVAALLPAEVAWAAEADVDPAPTPAAKVPAFHRTYLPADELKNRSWSEGYLPIESKLFEELLQTISSAAAGAPAGQVPEIESVEYEARVVGDDLLVGTATVQLSKPADTPRILPLDPCNLALASASWLDRAGKTAVLGTGPDGRLHVLADGSQLGFAWSLRGERTASGAVQFALRLPTCPMARLVVEAPAGSALTTDHGVATRDSAHVPPEGRWTIELGGQRELVLRIVPEDVARQRRPLTLLRQAVTYEVSTRGINVAAQLKLDIHGEPLERIAIDLDPDLRLVNARYGEQDIPWAATADVESRMTHAVLQLPEPIAGTGRVLQLSAIAPLVTDRQWRLPSLRPQGMSWQEGTAELLIPSLFVLERLTTEGGRQSRITALPAPLAGESFELQFFRPGATIDISLAQPRERVRIDSGTLVEVGPSQTTSVASVKLSLARGQRRTAQIDVCPGWSIDSVESAESKRPIQWESEEPAPDRSRLRIRTAVAIAPDNPMLLTIRGHRASTAGASHEAEQLEMLSFEQFQRGTRLISVRAAEGSELRWTGLEELTRLDPLKLSPAEAGLFAHPPADAVFSDDAAFLQAGVTLERRKPTYSADLRIDAAIQDRLLSETYTIECVPEAARVERLLVHFSHAQESPLEWNLAGGNSGQFSARKLSPAEQAQTSAHASGEVWELNVRLARSGPFELRAIRSRPLEGETSISLASVADAAAQRGTVAIRALGNTGLTIKNRGLTAVPAELLDASRYQTARATYHYQPARDDVESESDLTISPGPVAGGGSGAWAWSNRLDSRYSADGSAVHWATFQIQTTGRQQLRLSVGDEATLQAVWLDGQRLLQHPSKHGGTLAIELPPGRSLATLSLCYVTAGGLPKLAARSEPSFPTLDIPVMARRWSVWLPPGYAIVDQNSDYPSDSIVPPTWSQRLFGSLGRGAEQKVFNPLLVDDWRANLATTDSDTARRDAEHFVEILGTFLAEFAAGDGLTWGQLLALCEEADGQPRRGVLVDTDSLAWLGLTSQTIVPIPAGQSAVERGRALLAQSKLVLLAGAEAVILTSVTSAASQAVQLATTPHDSVLTLAPGPLADEVIAASQEGRWSRYQSVETWNAGPEGERAAWLSGGLATKPDDPQGWNVYTLRFSETGRPSVRIVNAPAMKALAWTVFLALVGVGLWKSLLPTPALVIATAASACAALLMLAAYVPLASAAVLAGLFCLALRFTKPGSKSHIASDLSRGSRKVRSSVIHEMARLLLVAAMLHLTWEARAEGPANQRSPSQPSDPTSALPVAPGAGQQPAQSQLGTVDAAKSTVESAEPSATRTPIYRVLVPTDENQKPLGDKYYIPTEFFRQLHRDAATARAEPRDWLVSRASYQGALARDSMHHRLGVLQLKAVFDLQVLQPNTRVRLPLSRQATAAAIVAARLEGRSIPIPWDPTGDALVIGPLAADRYRLELDFQPTLELDASSAGFKMPIPPLANASLELTFPTDAPAIELPTARGQVESNKDRGQLLAQLGPCDRLSVRWPITSGPEAAAPNLEVDELIWVKVRPGTTVLDAKFKYRVLGGRVQQLRLLTDPRLRPLPPTSQDSPIAAMHTVPGDPQRIDLELSRPVAESVVIDLSFLVTNTSGVGNLRLPRLESTVGRATKRWLAVTVDPALQPKIQAGEDSRTLDIPEFTSAWGESDVRPQAAYSIPRGEPVWVLSTQPSEPRIAVEQVLALSLARNSVLVHYDAQLSITGGHLLQLALQGPKGLVVEHVSVLEDELQRVARFSCSDQGRVAVFLNAPLDGRQRLLLRGRWDKIPGDTFEAPRLELVGADTKKRQLHVYRQPSVLADVQRAASATPIDSDYAEPIEGFGAVLGRYGLEDAAPVTISLRANAPKTRAISITYLRRDADRWIAQLDHRLEVSEGMVDSLQFEIPPQWSGPYSIEPAVPYQVVSAPGEQRPHVIVYPEKPIAGKYRLRISGRVALSAGDRLRAPDIMPLRTGQLERFVVLPQRLDAHQVVWDTFRLGRASLPAAVAAEAPVSDDQAVYQVAGERFQASLKAVERSSAVSRVALADFHLIWQADGTCQGIALFDVEPRGATSCVLDLEPGCRLLHASVESLPALISEMEANRWRLTLASAQLPQRIEVIFTVSWSGSTNHWSVAAPHLAGLEVGHTLWTVYGPSAFGRPRAQDGASLAAGAELELRRLSAISALVQLPPEVVGEHLPEEVARWYRPWRQRYAAARSALELAQTTRAAATSDTEIDARDLDKQISAVDVRLGGTIAAARGVPLAPPAAELLHTLGDHLAPSHYLIRGESHRLELPYPQGLSSGFWSRALGGLLALLVGGGAVFLLRGRVLPTFAPTVTIGVMGTAWWLLLAPSFIGLAAVLVAVWFALRGRRRTSWLPAA